MKEYIDEKNKSTIEISENVIEQKGIGKNVFYVLK